MFSRDELSVSAPWWRSASMTKVTEVINLSADHVLVY